MQALSETFPWVKPLYDGCDSNRVQWERLAEQVDMGLTWIDHETIEKPVERDNAEGTSHYRYIHIYNIYGHFDNVISLLIIHNYHNEQY